MCKRLLFMALIILLQPAVLMAEPVYDANVTVDLIAVEVIMCVVLVMAWAQLRTRAAGA